MNHQTTAKTENKTHSQWLWFAGIYIVSIGAYAAVQYGGRWLVHTFS